MIKDTRTLTLAVRPYFCIAYVIGHLIRFTMDKDEIVSAFAFKTGKLIEELIKKKRNDI